LTYSEIMCRRKHQKDAVRRNPPGWTPPGLWAPLSGHLTIALPLMSVEVLLGWIPAMVLPSLGPGRLDLVVAGVAVGNLIHAVVAVVIERPFVIRGRLMSPGGWGFAVWPLVGASGAVLAVSVAWLGSGRGLAVAGAIAVVETALAVYLRPWRPGLTQAEYDEKWAALKEMTKETFAPDVAEIRRRLDERAMDGYRRKIAERDAQRQRDGEGSTREP
jgi:hypothetical protein